MYDKVLVLCEVMVRYWYCANIPPRRLEDKTTREFENWSEKDKKNNLDQSEAEKLKKVVLKQKFSQDVGGGV